MPMMHNYYSQGKSWKEHDVVSENVFERNSVMREGSEKLWEFAHSLIEDAVEKGYLASSNKNEDNRNE